MESSFISVSDQGTTYGGMEDEGRTAMLMAVDGRLAGIIGVADVVKATSQEAISELRKMGIEVIMLTGDNPRTAKVIASPGGHRQYIAEVLPENKAQEVARLQGEGRKVAMVGDGVNDAPALAQADVGIAIGSGTDVAMETGDIVLIRSDLTDVVAAIQLSKRTMSKIRQNLFWALGYNSAGIPIAAGVLYPFFGILLNPIVAAAAMAMSSVSVVTNAALLKRYTPEIKSARRSKKEACILPVRRWDPGMQRCHKYRSDDGPVEVDEQGAEYQERVRGEDLLLLLPRLQGQVRQAHPNKWSKEPIRPRKEQVSGARPHIFLKSRCKGF